jgi:uncharacterized protein
VRSPSPPTDLQIEKLAAFLADVRRPDETLGYAEMRGFLFAVVTAPTLLLPSEWVPIIFAGKEAGFETLKEAEAIMGTIMGCYNQTVSATRSHDRVPPADVGIDTESEESLRRWAIGFATGIHELEDEWDAVLGSLSDHEFQHFERVFSALTVWADPRARQTAVGVSASEMKELLQSSRDQLPELLHRFAAIGLGAVGEVPAVGRGERRVAGHSAQRNDPCPCGSGKKYKRCCGVN